MMRGKKRDKNDVTSLCAAKKAIDAAERGWKETAAQYVQAFSTQKAKLTELKHHYLNLHTEQQAELGELGKNVEQIQLQQHLQNHFISDKTIAGIGASREAVLRSYGIETAFDVQQLSTTRIPGFGPKLATALMNWREGIVRQFRFDPKTGIPAAELNMLGLKYHQLRQNLQQQLQRGPAELQTISAQAEQHLSRLESQIQVLLPPLAQARADLDVMNE